MLVFIEMISIQSEAESSKTTNLLCTHILRVTISGIQNKNCWKSKDFVCLQKYAKNLLKSFLSKLTHIKNNLASNCKRKNRSHSEKLKFNRLFESKDIVKYN